MNLPTKNIITSILTLIIVLCASTSSLAQTNKKHNVDFGAVVGFLLPQNFGLYENFLMTGARLSKGISDFRPEFMYLKGSENGAEFELFDLSLKNKLFVDDFGGIRPIWTIGWHYAIYKKPDQGGVVNDYQKSPGLHYGFGFEIPLASSMALRNDFSLGNGPGRILVIGLALQWSFDEKSKDGQPPN